MLRRSSFAPLLVFAAALLMAVACSSSSPSETSDTSSVPAVTAATTGPTTSGTGDSDASADSMHTDSSHVTRFDAPGSVTCSGTATVTVTYETVDLTTVAFVVDDATSGVQAPNSGTHDLSLPCDGGVHTIMLIGTGPAGPAFASRAVATQPT